MASRRCGEVHGSTGTPGFITLSERTFQRLREAAVGSGYSYRGDSPSFIRTTAPVRTNVPERELMCHTGTEGPHQCGCGNNVQEASWRIIPPRCPEAERDIRVFSHFFTEPRECYRRVKFRCDHPGRSQAFSRYSLSSGLRISGSASRGKD